MKIKDLVFKCIKYGRTDFDGFTGEMNVYTKKGDIFIKGQKYCSKDKDLKSEYSKQGCKKSLVKFIKKYEKEIDADILRITKNNNA